MATPRTFTCDPVKNMRNVEARGIDLVEGAERFDFDTAVIAIDDRQDYGEVREVAIGFIDGRLHVLVFTKRPPHLHVISLRKANSREVRSYVEQTAGLE